MCFAFLSSVLRRRIQYLVAFAGMTAVFAIWTGVSARYDQTGDSGSAYAVVAMIFVYYLFYTIMHPLTYIYITEVFPFVHRAKGVAMTQFFSRAGSAFNQFVNPIGLDNIGWRFYIVYVVSQLPYLRLNAHAKPWRSGSRLRPAQCSSLIRRPKDQL